MAKMDFTVYKSYTEKIAIQRWKRLTCCLMAFLVAIALCACGESGDEPQKVLITFSDLDSGATYSIRLQADEYAIIGRHSDSDIVLSSRYVSRTHCKLSFSDGKFFIEDMDSTNGTFLLKDEAFAEVTDAVEITEGDVLLLADTYLLLEDIR